VEGGGRREDEREKEKVSSSFLPQVEKKLDLCETMSLTLD